MARPKSTPGASSLKRKAAPLKHDLSSAITTPLRQSKRAKSASNTPASANGTAKKSQYFERDSEISEDEFTIKDEESGYEDEDQSVSAVSSPPESEEEMDEDEEEYESEDARPRKRGRKKATKGIIVAENATKGKELWRPGVKSDLEPGKEVFIKLPKARQAGKTPYQDDTIHPNTFLFLGDLKRNNDREWLKVHDADYRQAQADWSTFVGSVTEKLMEKDDTIPELPPKDLVFRIYRDVRFSPDPTPYKTHFSAAWSRTGRKGAYAHYYVQVGNGSSFLGGGFWNPDAPTLAALRRDVDRRSPRLKKVLLDPQIRKAFLGGVPSDERKAVKAFVGLNAENMLKKRPNGYEADNPNIDLLRLRNWILSVKLKDEEIMGPKGGSRIAELFGAMTPYITWLNSVVLPDGDAGDSSSDDDEDEENEEEES